MNASSQFSSGRGGSGNGGSGTDLTGLGSDERVAVWDGADTLEDATGSGFDWSVAMSSGGGMTGTKDSVGTGTTEFLNLANTTDGVLGTVQRSPVLSLKGEAHDGVDSADAKIGLQAVPVEASELPAPPLVEFQVHASIDGGAYTEAVWKVASDGVVTMTGDLDLDGNRIILDSDATSLATISNDQVSWTIGGAARFLFTTDGIDFNGVGRVVFDADADTYAEATTDDQLDVYTLGTLAMRIDAQQQVAAGQNGAASAPSFTFDGNNAMGMYRAGNTLGLAGNGSIGFAAANAIVVTLAAGSVSSTTTGNVDLGTSSLEWGNLFLQDFARFGEMGSAPSGVANKAILFAEDNGAGKTRLMVQFGTGAAQQVAIEP